MASASSLRRVLIGILAGTSVLLLIGVMAALALDAGYLRRPLIAWLATTTGRHIEVAGHLQSHLLARHPYVVAEQVTIGNPSWMPSGTTARIDRLTLELAILANGRLLRIERLALEGARLSLVRNADGNANWQLTNQPDGDALPLIRNLSIPAAQATLADARRHLNFEGLVSVQDRPDRSGVAWLQIAGHGRLNDTAVDFETISDPLTSASRRRPYRFSFAERSHHSRLSGHGMLTHAFDFDHLQTHFEAAGENLKDLYSLAGVSLINTGSYHLSGTLERRDTLSIFKDLAVNSGDSDVSGSVSVDGSGKRPSLSGDLHSNVLRLADLGQRAAPQESAAQPLSPFLLSDATLKPDAVRHGEAKITFQVQRLDTTRLSLHQVAGTLSIDHGILTVSSLNAQLLDGQLHGRWQMNATSDNPFDTVDLQLEHLQIGQLDHASKSGPRYEGLLNAQVNITGHGSSVHQIGSSAEGRISAQLLSGTLRQSLAELTGMDLKGVGLSLTRSRQQEPIRCGVANFAARDGTLTTDDLVIDTDDVRINGEGSVRLAPEALHLELRGHPKQTRLLRLKAPVLISGTLLHPHVGLESPKSLQLIDRGSDKIVDCQALLAH